MVIRVRVELKSVKEKLTTTALANAGYETDKPEVILPIKVAEKLGLYPKLPSGSEVKEYKGIGGIVVRTFVVEGRIGVSVLTSDRRVQASNVTAVITPGEDEVILSDRTIDSLKLVLLKPGEGIWRFIDDKEEVVRKSEPMERW